MCTAIVGRIGVGKSHYIVKHLYKNYAKAGNCIIMTNFNCSFATHIVRGKDDILDFLTEVREAKESGFQPCDFNPKWTSSAVIVVIDEVQNVFNNDTWQQLKAGKGKIIKEVLSEGRKKDIYIFLLTQSYGLIGINFRRYISEVIYFKPLIPIYNYIKKQIPSKTGNYAYRREMRYLFPIFHKFIVKPANEDETLLTSMEILMRTFHFSGYLSPKYYKFYDSYEIIKSESQILENNVDFPLLKAVLPSTLGHTSKDIKKTLLGTFMQRIYGTVYLLSIAIDNITSKIIYLPNKTTTLSNKSAQAGALSAVE
jgi:Zonular occludens toxin (Zot)